jgi:DNA uptake protein ComE-like DNA-binding protein
MEGINSVAKRHCPHCGCASVAHSRVRAVIEGQFLRTLRLGAYRCCDCCKRFYGRTGPPRSPSSRAAGRVASSHSGTSGGTVRRALKIVAMFLTIAAFAVSALASSGSGGQASGAKVDLNSASEKDLETLPGVGAATAKKIIAGRPYSSAGDLSKAGVSAATIKKITPLVTFGNATPTAAPGKSTVTKTAASTKPAASSAPSTPVDLNTASEKDLEDLPGVGPATAKKIISGRPYSSASDLSKAGVSAATIKKITPLVTVGNAPVASASPQSSSSASKRRSSSSADATPPPPSNPPPSSSAAPVATAPAESTPPAAAPPAVKSAPQPQPLPGSGMVWVNLDSGVYHKEGSRYYGKTKNGKYMPEADALKAGYRAAKNE